ncbi:lipopolysaccharide assembly protein LapA domain-containing protein [Rubritalea sp.]|uniref:lipopolysaccharide assembly protein LapA domain-containing protein n=1 Tax=Rubritalea sp. TaxID=2109375 RepID=UPI003EF66EAC
MTTGKKIRLGIIIAITLVAAIVILQNREQVTTNILFTSIEMPQAFLLFLTFLVGALAGFVLAYMRLSSRLSSVQKSIEKR